MRIESPVLAVLRPPILPRMAGRNAAWARGGDGYNHRVPITDSLIERRRRLLV
jgi:hypothetical protein